ncbi:hypothetical protein OG252_13285 [Streptomyces sp. NBC_01352]|uniref:hypothetical protein n=1 Tax=Streptomyces sp. NBC_01352 TaxID=2903834 RepID=UPI002E3421A6|nr:hypothetical protein [Streptomyces sp. NBC_01352]
MTTTATPTLFDDEPPTTPARQPPTPERPQGVYGLRPAEARLIAAHDPDIHDPNRRPCLYLVVTHCPYCEHQHIHPAGHLGEPRLCPRNSRCIGQTNGAYYFPAVHQ